MQTCQQPLHIAASAYSIAIHPSDPRPREQLLQPFFPLLRPSTQKIKMFALALRTDFWHRSAKPAVVTLQPLPGLGYCVVLTHLLVIRHRDRAVLALNLLP